MNEADPDGGGEPATAATDHVPDNHHSTDRVGATLLLENGMSFRGYSFGARTSVGGEAVFQTGMVGYTEALTDPSYHGQLLVLTYPIIGNYGVPSADEVDEHGIPRFVESLRVWTAGLIVCQYSEHYSHWNAVRSLGSWLEQHGVPAMCDVDTRHLTQIIREQGTMLGRIIVDGCADVPLVDPNTRNLVDEVSTRQIQRYGHVEGEDRAHVLVVDCGLKLNQLRCLLARGVRVTVVPWDADLAALDDDIGVDGVFLSNGPGDPRMCDRTVAQLRALMRRRRGRPIFGICLGHQLLSIAAGFRAYKLPYGNRGHNQPCVDELSGRCYITSQNHGYAVDASPAHSPPEWTPLFRNANDGTNEGVSHVGCPFFSVQFHPEACAGPHDTAHLFDVFVRAVNSARRAGRDAPPQPAFPAAPPPPPPPPPPIRKVMVLGSGGLSIGQAGEFDYSGSQAIKALKEEGVYTVLVNPNIATVQTSRGMADKVYFLPVNEENVLKVLHNERPDGILMTFGGQTALNCGTALYERGELAKLGVEVLGTPVRAILDTEDRERFNARLEEIGEPYARSCAVTSVADALAAAADIGYPVIARAAFALGGLGSGFADNDEQLRELAQRAFSASPQLLVERSMRGWKEVEYEVVRDAYDNCVTVCNMENFDPLGVHTGDSIVVAPSQTLDDAEYHMLRDAAQRTVRMLGVVGECNVQFALQPSSRRYCIIEVNARLSRSSALASKATGYPLAFVAAKLALRRRLSDIRNSITRRTTACFEPSLDYLVVKMPRWDLRKFERVSRRLGSAMKSVGEVMAIGRSFEEAIQKAVRMVSDNYVSGLEPHVLPYDAAEMREPTDERLLRLASGLAEGVGVGELHELSRIDRWFLHKLRHIARFGAHVRRHGGGGAPLPPADVARAKQLGFSDRQLAALLGDTEMDFRQRRLRCGVRPCVKQIDTVAAEFPAFTNYLYMTYSCPRSAQHDVAFDGHGYMVLGSGAYRIGSSVEFDWCAVSAIHTLKAQALRAIMINYNPETVSTDYDECDRLYFEELSLERVLDTYELERARGVIVSMGGQIPNNLAMSLHRQQVNILGTSPDMIDSAENRYKFSRMLDRLHVDQPRWKELTSVEDARAFCAAVGYPVLVRPSYVLSGAAMNVAHKADDLRAYLTEAASVSADCPVVVSKFILEAKEIEVDAVARRGELVMHVVAEHVENAGVHSGDATLVLPPVDLDDITVRKVEQATRMVAHALNVTGPMNIQFIAKDNEIKVIECNLRASRSFPFVSKTVGVDLAKMATKVMLGKAVRPYPVALGAAGGAPHIGVKVAQFSFTRLLGADPILGVEMASTGEVACFGASREEAYLKALAATGQPLARRTVCVSIGTYKDKLEFLSSARLLRSLGVRLFATPGSADFLEQHGVAAEAVVYPQQHEFVGGDGGDAHNVLELLRRHEIELLINIPSNNKYRRLASFTSRGYLTRRAAVDHSVPLITNIKLAKLYVNALRQLLRRDGGEFPLRAFDARFSARVVTLPGLINLDVLPDGGGLSWAQASTAALGGGFTYIGAAVRAAAAAHVERDFEAARERAARGAFCDVGLYAAASSTNAALLEPLGAQGAAHALSIDLERGGAAGGGGGGSSTPTLWLQHLSSWPATLPVMLRAGGSALASLLLGAVLHRRAIHVRRVRTRDDLQLIRLSKENGVAVTCDANVLDLFARPDDGGGGGDAAEAAAEPPRGADVEALWESLDVIDAISGPPELALPLVLQMEHEGRVSAEWVQQRLSDNPRQILGLAEQKKSFVEVDVSETWEASAASPLSGAKCRGKVRRVVVRGDIAYLDGKVWADPEKIRSAARARAGAATPNALRAKEEPSRFLKDVTVPVLDEEDIGSRRERGRSTKAEGALRAEALVGADDGAFPRGASAQAFDGRRVRLADGGVGARGGGDVGVGVGLREDDPAEAAALAAVPRLPPLLRASENREAMGWFGRHILTATSFRKEDLQLLFNVAYEMRQMADRVGHYELLRGKILANVFYEPSTRTSCSFEAAMKRLGGEVMSVIGSTSSATKGESLADTIRTLECYADVMVLRHPQAGAAQEAARFSHQPVINAGDGIGEHPTQALLDVFTIREELGTVNGITVTFVGDLANGRTVHSLAQLLSMYNVRLRYVSVPSLRMPPEVLADISARGIEQSEHLSLDEVLRDSDVLYVTRVQRERFALDEQYELVKNGHIITPKTLTRAKANAILMHPMPRTGEIAEECDSDPHAVYFRQMKYGMYIRMAVLALVLGKA